MRRSLPLRFWLLLLVAAAILPMAGIIGLTIVDRLAAAERDAFRRATLLSDIAARDTQLALDSSANLVAALAERPLVRALDETACDPFLTDATRLAREVVAIVTLERDGRVVCPGEVGLAGGLAAQAWFTEALAGDGIGHASRDVVPGSVVLPISRSIGDDGLLVLLLDLSIYTRPLAGVGGEGEYAVVTIVDERGTIVARSQAQAQYVGQPIDIAVPPADPSALAWQALDRGIDGVERYYANRRVPELGWTARAGLDRAAVLAAPRASAVRDLLLGGIGAAIALIGGVSLAATIHRRAARLAAAIGRSVDDQSHVAPAGLTELDAIASSFNALLASGSLVARERALLGAAVERSPIATLVLAADGQISFANHAAASMLALPEDGRPAGSVAEVFGEQYQARIGALLDDAAPRLSEEWSVERDGRRMVLAATYFSVAGAGDRRIVLFLRDLSRERLVEQQLREGQKLEAVGRLAGGVAHDFNGLLTAIIGFHRLALDRLPAGSGARRDIEAADEAAESAALLTRQLLAFGRRQMLRAEPLEVNTEIARFARLLRRMLGERTPLELDLATRALHVVVDRGQLEQLVTNLVINARDASPPGAPVIVRVRQATGAALARRFGEDIGDARYATISVLDRGAGMDAEILARATEPFFTTKPAGRGTGLGLSTVYGIARQSGGQLWLRSQPGRGTTATVALPLTEQRNGRAGTPLDAAPPARRTAGAGRGRVLVVEDEPLISRLVATTLRQAGYDVVVASSGEEALGALERSTSSIDLLLSDIVMAGMSGTRLAEIVTERWPATRVVFMTGYSDMPIEAAWIGVPLLNKPFTPAQLLNAVASVLAPASA